MTGVYTVPEFGPSDLMVTPREGTRRIKTEDGRSSFYEGHQFRGFKVLSLPASGQYVIKIVVPINGILQNVAMSVHAGDVTLSTRGGGTEGGVFTAEVPIFAKNRMIGTPAYDRQFLITGGGTQTGGVEVDNMRVIAASATGQRQSVSTSIDERGVEPGTYYWVFINNGNGTAEVNFSAWWSEHPY
jgi:hypothetical protein